MKTILSLFVLSLLVHARAEVVPFIHSFSPSTTLTIPAGKVLVIEQILSSSPVVDLKITYNNTGSGINTLSSFLTVKLANTNSVTATLQPLERVIRVRAGWTLQNLEATPLVIFGLAMNEADLYAAVPNQLENISIEGQNARVFASLASPRPVLLSVESSTDLNSWAHDPNASVSAVGGPSQIEALTDTADDVKAIRIQTRARQTEQ